MVSAVGCERRNLLKASVFIATSLDGFIARENGDVDWLPPPGADGTDEDYGYKAFIDSVDVLLMGRRTFEKALSFGEWPYGQKPVIVLSRRTLKIPKHLARSVEVMWGAPEDLVQELAGRNFMHAYIDGGKTIQGFLERGLIQQLIITRVPILIGDGIPLFGPLALDIKLRHVHTRQFGSGLVQSRYDVMG